MNIDSVQEALEANVNASIQTDGAPSELCFSTERFQELMTIISEKTAAKTLANCQAELQGLLNEYRSLQERFTILETEYDNERNYIGNLSPGYG